MWWVRSGLARYYHSNEVSVPVLNPLAHWAGAKSLIKFGASIRYDDPALLRLARGRSWPVVPRLVYRATRRSPTRIWSWLMPTIWPTVASRASSPCASVRPNTDPNGGEWAEITVPVRRWSIETQREGIFGWPPEQKVPSSNLGSRTVLSRELRPASKDYLRKSCNSCGGETGR